MKRRRKSFKKDFRMIMAGNMLENAIERFKTYKFSEKWNQEDWLYALEAYIRHFEELLSINKEATNRIGFDALPTERDLQNIKVNFLNDIAFHALNLTVDDLKNKYEVA